MDVPIVPEALRKLGDAPVRIDWYGDVVQSHIPLVNLSCSPSEAESAETTLLRRPSLNVELPIARALDAA